VPAKTLAYVTPEVLRWARESTGYSIQDAAERIRVPWYTLAAAEEGADLLTLRQAERAADAYERPLASLFLPAPPQEEPQEVQFRRLPGTPTPPWPPAMRFLARRTTERQEAAIELYDALDESPPWVEVAKGLAEESAAEKTRRLSRVARDLLGVTVEEQEEWTDRYAPLRAWTDAVEAQGVLVMQDGSMDVEQLRGFASVEPMQVPAIVVNTGDDPRARAFTVVHEFGHIVRRAVGLPVGPEAEAWCNQFAGEVLMPPARLAERFHGSGAKTLLGRVEEMAAVFSVTPLAAAVRIARSEMADREEAGAVIHHIEQRSTGGSRRGDGGDYYLNRIVDFGPGYLRLVFDALDSNVVTHPTASRLLGGVQVDNFEKLRDTLARRN
jgi:Zn-dependent peptidase ImmA (M78 family)